MSDVLKRTLKMLGIELRGRQTGEWRSGGWAMCCFAQPRPHLCHTLSRIGGPHATNEISGGITAARFAARVARGSTGQPLAPRAAA